MIDDIISRLNQMGEIGFRCCPLKEEEIEMVRKELVEVDDHYYLIVDKKDGTTWLNWE